MRRTIRGWCRRLGAWLIRMGRDPDEFAERMRSSPKVRSGLY